MIIDPAQELKPGKPVTLHNRVIECLEPPEQFRSWDWITEHCRTKKGSPFNGLDFPWVRGIADAWDDPTVRRVFFQAGSRLGKTETFCALMQASQHRDPDTGMIGGPSQSLVERTIRDRMWKAMSYMPILQPIMPPEHRRAAQVMRTRTFTIHGAWSGSPATLGDLDPRYLMCLEVDKFSEDQSSEADSFELILERGAEIPDRKLAGESTPSISGKSRIERYVNQGWNCRFHVPCPHCGGYQQLRRNDTADRAAGGLWWDRDDDGRTTASRAYRSAEYVCEFCGEEIGEDDRRPAIRKGVWCAEGQRVRKDGTLEGERVNDGPDASFQLSRLYGATFTFADYAREFVASQDNTEKMRSFANNWDGEAWTPQQQSLKWEELAARLCVNEHELGVIPESCLFVTTAIDVQVDHLVWGTFAWGQYARGHLLGYGTVPDWSAAREVISREYEHADGGPPLRSMMTLVDARDGNRTDEVVNFCRQANSPRRGPWVFPSMGVGSKKTANLKSFTRQSLDDAVGKTGNRKPHQLEGFFRIMVDTRFYQEWIDNAMYRRRPDDSGSISLPISIADDHDFFDQLLNEVYDPDEGTWVPVASWIPVDFRDVVRYSRCAAEVYMNGGWPRLPASRPRREESVEERRKRQSATTAPKPSQPKPPQEADRPKRSGFVRQTSRSAFLRR